MLLHLLSGNLGHFIDVHHAWAFSSGALHSLNTIVHPMLSQFYGVFLGLRLSCETNFIMELKFSLVPGDNCICSPHIFFIMSDDRDCVAMMYDVVHLEQSELASRRPLLNITSVVSPTLLYIWRFWS
jgi:hypothetical protein